MIWSKQETEGSVVFGYTAGILGTNKGGLGVPNRKKWR